LVPAIDGICDSRFGAVRDAFAGNFGAQGEAGAAICLTVGKGMLAVLVARLADALYACL
jgi:hypothetical protein